MCWMSRRRRKEETEAEEAKGGERERMRQTAVILLVILSGSLEKRALLRQLSEDKARNKQTDSPLCSSSARYAPPPSPFRVSFFHEAVCHVSKLRHKQRCPPGHLSSAMLLGLSLGRKRQRLEFSPACPLVLIPSIRHPCSCQPLHLSF